MYFCYFFSTLILRDSCIKQKMWVDVHTVYYDNTLTNAQRREEGMESYKQSFLFVFFKQSFLIFLELIYISQPNDTFLSEYVYCNLQRKLWKELKNITKEIKVGTRKYLFNRKYKAVEQREDIKHVEKSKACGKQWNGTCRSFLISNYLNCKETFHSKNKN